MNLFTDKNIIKKKKNTDRNGLVNIFVTDNFY